MACLYVTVLFITFYLTSGLRMKYGTYSRTCRNATDSIELRHRDTVSSKMFKCSCSPSCLVYQDCCYDSPFQFKGTMQTSTICLPISKRSGYLAVAECPKEQEEHAHLCTSIMRDVSPVTSKITGTTYANKHCAICHGDGSNLKTWNVKLRCCDEHDDPNVAAERYFTYNRGYLWSTLPNHTRCICSYHAHGDDYSFMDSLELRRCHRTNRFKRSSIRTGDRLRQLCRSFMDPEYSTSKIDRDRYCIQCRFRYSKNNPCRQKNDVRRLAANMSNLRKRPNARNSTFFRTKGGKYRYSYLLKPREETSGTKITTKSRKRCRKGQIFDKRSKHCRKQKKVNRDPFVF